MSVTRSRWKLVGSAWTLGLFIAGGAFATEPNAVPDAGSCAGAAVAGGGKAAFWSRGNAKLALSGVTVGTPQWSAEVNADDSRLAFSQEEQQELLQHLRGTLDRLVTPTPLPVQSDPAADPEPDTPATAAATAAGIAATTTAAALSLQVRITHATMPNITRNLFVMALPIPIPGIRSLLRSRGGAGIDVAFVRPGETEPLASFQCDYQVGMISILDSYRRLAQAKTAMERCVDTLARSAPEGRLVDGGPVVAAAEAPTKVP